MRDLSIEELRKKLKVICSFCNRALPADWFHRVQRRGNAGDACMECKRR